MTGTPPTRTRIEAWQQTAQRLSGASRHWRMGADQLEGCAEIYVAQVVSPGGTEWSGPGAELAAVSSRVDRRSAYNGAEVARRLADVASRGAEGLRWGRELALAAIAEAENDGFAVTEDLAIADRWAGRESDCLSECR